MAVFNFDNSFHPDSTARAIADRWQEWTSYRNAWVAEKDELTAYIYATDTRKTTNNRNDWKNSTVRPKLCQIYDNLVANYIGSLFPNSNWLTWKGNTREDSTANKVSTIINYMKSKLSHEGSQFEEVILQCLTDYVLYGNCFARTEYVNDRYDNGTVYVGPRIVRISPYDVVMQPTAPTANQAPKIVRILTTIGDLRKAVKTKPDLGYTQSILDDVAKNRKTLRGHSEGDMSKNKNYSIDGFGTYTSYWHTDVVELLEFHGDFYDIEKDELTESQVITVIDRMYVLGKRPNPSWRGQPQIKHAGWRTRPDNLWAMGPLDNLVGMQYRIDHLENLKADAFDYIAFPIYVCKGTMDDFSTKPGTKVFIDTEESIEALRPDTTVLNADLQIADLMESMEELAGAPRQAMGIRTPGEKTKFEVQTLENNSSRVYQQKAARFEKQFLEALLNDMLEQARRNLDETGDVVRIEDSSSGIVTFRSITRQDIEGDGTIVAMGARHFAEQANTVQNLNAIFQNPLMQDPLVKVHFSGLNLATTIAELLDIEEYNIVAPYIGLEETMQLQQRQQEMAQINESDSQPVPSSPGLGSLEEGMDGGGQVPS